MEVNVQKEGIQYRDSIKTGGLITSITLLLFLFLALQMQAQSFSQSNLNLNGQGSIDSGTSLMYGPDGRLYVLSRNGNVDIFTVQKNGDNDYIAISGEELTQVATIPNHNDFGASAGGGRQATGLTVAGTAPNPIIYVTSSDAMKLDRAKTLQGGELKISTDGGVHINDAKVIKADILTANGVIHVIDSVLLPN